MEGGADEADAFHDAVHEELALVRVGRGRVGEVQIRDDERFAVDVRLSEDDSRRVDHGRHAVGPGARATPGDVGFHDEDAVLYGARLRLGSVDAELRVEAVVRPVVRGQREIVVVGLAADVEDDARPRERREPAQLRVPLVVT